MSSIGQQKIYFPQNTSVYKTYTNSNICLNIKGPHGKIVIKLPEGFLVDILPDNSLKTWITKNNTFRHKLWGTFNRRIQQNIKGASQGHSVFISLRGIGYKAFLENSNSTDNSKKLLLKLGKAHDIFLDIPKFIDIKISNDPNPLSGGGENQYIHLTSYSLDKVTSFADQIKKLRPPEPYKSKGVLIRNPRNDALIKALAKPPKGAKSR